MPHACCDVSFGATERLGSLVAEVDTGGLPSMRCPPAQAWTSRSANFHVRASVRHIDLLPAVNRSLVDGDQLCGSRSSMRLFGRKLTSLWPAILMSRGSAQTHDLLERHRCYSNCCTEDFVPPAGGGPTDDRQRSQAS